MLPINKATGNPTALLNNSFIQAPTKAPPLPQRPFQIVATHISNLIGNISATLSIMENQARRIQYDIYPVSIDFIPETLKKTAQFVGGLQDKISNLIQQCSQNQDTIRNHNIVIKEASEKFNRLPFMMLGSTALIALGMTGFFDGIKSLSLHSTSNETGEGNRLKKKRQLRYIQCALSAFSILAGVIMLSNSRNSFNDIRQMCLQPLALH
jgi:hypothetical protein